ESEPRANRQQHVDIRDGVIDADRQAIVVELVPLAADAEHPRAAAVRNLDIAVDGHHRTPVPAVHAGEIFTPGRIVQIHAGGTPADAAVEAHAPDAAM